MSPRGREVRDHVGRQMLSTCYVPDNPWLASSHTTSKDQGQVGANDSRKYSSSSPHRHHTGLSELRGKKQQQPTIYNLAWRDAHARTTQESHLARAMRDSRRVRRTPSQPTGSYKIYVVSRAFNKSLAQNRLHFIHTCSTNNLTSEINKRSEDSDNIGTTENSNHKTDRHTHTHAHAHAHAHTRTHARTHTHAHTRARTHTHAHTHTHTNEAAHTSPTSQRHGLTNTRNSYFDPRRP